MSLSGGMDNKATVHFKMEYLLWSNKKEQTMDTLDNMDESQMHYTK